MLEAHLRPAMRSLTLRNYQLAVNVIMVATGNPLPFAMVFSRVPLVNPEQHCVDGAVPPGHKARCRAHPICRNWKLDPDGLQMQQLLKKRLRSI